MANNGATVAATATASVAVAVGDAVEAAAAATSNQFHFHFFWLCSEIKSEQGKSNDSKSQSHADALAANTPRMSAMHNALWLNACSTS